MKGRFKTYSCVMWVLSMIFYLPITTIVCISDRSLKRCIIYGVVIVLIWSISQNLPARFTADENEKYFDIWVGLRKRRICYADISRLECEYKTEINTTELRIYRQDGKITKFTENNEYSMDDIEYRQEIAKPQLMRLYEYINNIMGGNVYER